MNPSSGPSSGSSDPKSPKKDFEFSALKTLESVSSLEADAVNTTGALAGGRSDTPQADAYLAAKEHALKRRRIIGFSLLSLAIITGVILIFVLQGKQKTADIEHQDASKRYPTTTIPLAELAKGSGATVLNNQVLSVNGQLNVNNALVLTPGAKPTTAIAGQMYYDQTTNKLTYYDGTQFQTIAAGSDIPVVTPPTPTTPTSIGGASGAVGLGSGLSVAGNTLSNTGVLTLQGQAGNVTLTSGGGITINGTTLSNSGVLSLGGQNGEITVGSGLSVTGGQLKNTGIISAVGAGTITVTNDGNGNIVIDGPGGGGGSGTVASLGGNIGRIAKFTGVQTIADSLLSESGTTVTVNGDLTVTSALNLATALSVTNGGTGSTTAAGARTNLGAAKNGANSDITSLSGLTTALSVAQGGTGVGTLPTNSVVLGNGTSSLNSVVAGAAGLCLVSTGGAPTFTTCPGSGGVASMNGLTGALSIANASGSGATITINDATTAAKGIASFNATNFLVSSGAVNTVQDIAVTSSPTFAGLTLTAPLAVGSGGTGRNTLTSNGVVVGNGTSAVNSVTGSNGQCLVVSAGAPVFTTCPGSGGVSSVNSQTGAVTIQGVAGSSVSTSSGVVTINDASSTVKGLASFNSTNFSVSSGAVNTVQDIATTSAPSFGQLSVVSNQATGKMLTINNTNAAATGNLLDLQQNGTSRLTVAPSGNLTTTGTIASGLINGQTISSTANFTGSLAVAGNLAVNTIANTGALTVGVGNQSFTLQGNASSTLRSTSGANTTTVGFQSPTANVTYNFAAASAGTYSICTTAGNCVGVGGSVSTGGGTTNQLAKFTGSTAIGDSIISDNGSTVTIGGTLSVNTITPTAALTVGATSQNLTMQGAAVTLSSTSGANTNSLVFASPSGGNKTITVPNATGTVAVSASGPLVLDSLGNLTCPTCLSGGGGGSGVSSVNGLSGALILQSSDAATFSNSGATITVSDASSTVKGVAKFDATNLTVTSGTVNTVQNISVTSTPTFAGLNLTTALTVGNGGTGATTALGARTNLGAAASGANSDITSLSGLTTALSVAQGGTGLATTPTNGQILIGNGTNFSLNTLTAGSGINISNTAGSITISAPTAGTCAGCANTSLNNLSGVAINTSLLPGTAGGANLGSSVLPFGQLSLAGTSGTPATNNFLITGASTGGTRTITLPDASGTIAVSASGNIALSANGNITFTGQLPVANGGTGSNSASGARTNLGAAASGANSDITSLSGLTTALSVAQGGTGATSLTSNGVLLGNGTSAITSLTGSNGQCLVISSGAPTFTTCPGSGGVASINSQTGVVTIQGNDPSSVTTTAGSITINDATTALRGLASFNGTNFTVSSGAVNTIQNINTGAAPTFGQLTLTGANTLALGTSGGGGNAGSAKFYDGSTNFAGTLNTTTLTANRTIALPNESGTICLQNSANCGFLTGAAASGSYIQLQASTPGTAQTGHFNITGSGIAQDFTANNYYTINNYANLDADGLHSNSALGIATNNRLTLTTDAGTRIYNANPNQVGLSVSTLDPGGQIADAFQISAYGGSVNAAFNGPGNQLTLGHINTSGTVTPGVIVLADGTTSGFGATISTSTLTANRTISLPNESGTICLQNSANCGFLTGASGVQLQGTTPGTAQTGNLNISGTGIFGTALSTAQLTATGQSILGGGTNQTQVIVKANASQSLNTPLIMLQASGGTEIARINATANGDTFFGTYSGSSLSGGSGGNTGMGNGALSSLTTGNANVAIGQSALSSLVTGTENTAIGYGAAPNLTGGGNVAIGKNALGGVTNVDGNVAIGNGAGNVSGAGSNFYLNMFLGIGAGSTDNDNFATTTTLQRSAAIGYDAQVQSNRTIVLGGVGADYQQVVIGSTMNTGTNLFGVSPVVYSTGTASQSTTTITGVGTSWSNANGVYVGQRFIFANGTDGGTITAVNSTTSLTVSTSQTVSSQKYRIHNVGFQVDNSGNAYVRSTSTSAFGVQDANATSIFNVNTASGRVTIDGNGNNNGTVGYGLYFGDLFSGEGISSKRTAGGNQNGLDFYTNGAASFQLTNNGTALFKNGINSTTAFQIQNASSTALFTADTSTSTITLGNSASGNYVTFTAAGGLQSYGTARPTKYINLSAEYAGAVLYGGDTGGANCNTNQNGTMTSGYDTSSSQQSYYNWTSSQATNQCYDVVVRVPLPAGFDGWAAAPSIQVKTDNTGNSAYAIGIIKSDGSTYDTNYGSAYTSPGTLGTSWGNMATSSLDSSGYTAGSYMTIRIRMTAKSSANLQLGDIKLAYYSKY